MPSIKKLRQRTVEMLQPNIEAIEANDLECLAHALVEAIERRPLIQRGINARRRPVGRTVDSFSSDQSVIVECSTEETTFSPNFRKLREDIGHARKSNSACDRLYLFSSMRCPESQGAAVAQMIRDESFGHCIIEWYDSRRIAEAMFDHVIVNDYHREFFEDLLPCLGRLFAEYVFSNAAPAVPEDYVPDAVRADAVSQAISKSRTVNIFSLSGAGKSYAAIEYAAKHEDDYSAIFWVRGEDLRNCIDLKVVQFQRSGVPMNLSTLLRDTPCLVIFDNYPMPGGPHLDSLLPADMHPRARVLTTALYPLGGAVTDLELPHLSSASAKQILSSGKKPPSSQIAEEIVKFTNGHALILAILRDTVDELGISWESISLDIRENLALYESRDHQTILDRILTRSSDGIIDELLLLKWLGDPIMDGRFAEVFTGLAGFAKLRRRSILRPAGLGLFKLHDLVLECLKHFSLPGSLGLNPSARFWNYFESEWEISPPHFQRSLHFHRRRIATAIQADSPTPSLQAYLALLIEECPLSAIGVAALATHRLAAHFHDRAAVSSIVEAIEGKIRLTIDEGEKETLTRAAIRRLTDAISESPPAIIRTDLLHHRGKFSHWVGDDSEAINDFREVLRYSPDSWAALLQMARVLGNHEAGTYLLRIVDAYERAPATVPTTIILATFSELANPAHSALRDEIINQRITLIQTAIATSLVTGYSQPYRTLARLGRHLAFPQPQALLQMAGSVTFPPVELAKDGEMFDIAECLKCIGKAHREHLDDESAHKPWCRRALPFYERNRRSNAFQLTMHAECLNLLGEFSDADAILERAPENRREAHWWHRKAQALLGLTQLDLALCSLERSFEDPKAASFHGTFLQTKAKIQAAQNDPACIRSARLALEKVTLDKHRIQIERELKTYLARFDHS